MTEACEPYRLPTCSPRFKSTRHRRKLRKSQEIKVHKVNLERPHEAILDGGAGWACVCAELEQTAIGIQRYPSPCIAHLGVVAHDEVVKVLGLLRLNGRNVRLVKADIKIV
jgi:hypothetical protein